MSGQQPRFDSKQFNERATAEIKRKAEATRKAEQEQLAKLTQTPTVMPARPEDGVKAFANKVLATLRDLVRGVTSATTMRERVGVLLKARSDMLYLGVLIMMICAVGYFMVEFTGG